ncbi:KAP family NTPase [Shewanella olleyana]|uniref:KAP family P-loop NTPase fold protein n=1 Tax=Shewanella olleyana TaxID=135626 RepID=UPI00201064D2|nr:P-loop NTPase fold protein [Shewanella olleyana]MCL1067595.1 KAP family NTPase [Shewanella olleyana]
MSTNEIKKLAKHNDWLETHSFENCKLNRSDYGRFLLNFIIEEKDGFVLNIDSSWGSGKTEFLKRLYTESYQLDHPAVYIDAWESDFSKDPLSVVAFELLSQIEKLMESPVNGDKSDYFEKLKTTISEYKQSIGIFAGVVTSLTGLSYSAGKDFVGAITDNPPEMIEERLEELSSNYKRQTEALSEIKSTLSVIADLLEIIYGMKVPFIVLVDELDRCRPTYAIEMLEVVKHFFDTEKMVFIIATDTKQLSSSIQAIYGQKFDGQMYLKRFFDRTALLPAADFEAYLSQKDINLSKYQEIAIFPSDSRAFSVTKILSIICEVYKIEARDLDQILAQMEACLRQINAISTRPNLIRINLIVLFASIIEKHKNIARFDERTNQISKDLNTKECETIEIEDEFSSNHLINYSFQSILTVQHSEEAYFNDRNTTYIGPQEFDFLKHQYSSQSSNKERYIHSEIRNMLMNPEGTIWNWEQYKQCIELAGYIS